MASYWFIFRIFFVIYCLVTVTSYNIDRHTSFDDRHERAVTEWRFRRNYLFNFPYFDRNYPKNNHRNKFNQMNSIDKKHFPFLP